MQTKGKTLKNGVGQSKTQTESNGWAVVPRKCTDSCVHVTGLKFFVTVSFFYISLQFGEPSWLLTLNELSFVQYFLPVLTR